MSWPRETPPPDFTIELRWLVRRHQVDAVDDAVVDENRLP